MYVYNIHNCIRVLSLSVREGLKKYLRMRDVIRVVFFYTTMMKVKLKTLSNITDRVVIVSDFLSQ